MKAESNIKPLAFNIEECGSTIIITLYENIEEQERDRGVFYSYDEYRVKVPYRENFSIGQNYDKWLQYAKDKEYADIGDEIRAERNHLLALCDWTQSADSPLSDEDKARWTEYRQALRDIPEQEGFPYDVEFPKQPE